MKKIKTLIFLMMVVSEAFSQWTTSGTHIYNSNAGNVGIGTVSPLMKLDVAGNILLSNSGSNILGLFQSVSAAGTTYPGVYSYGSGLSLGTSGPITFIGNGGNIEVGRFSSTGDFGVGTVSPLARMHITASAPSINGRGTFFLGTTATSQVANSGPQITFGGYLEGDPSQNYNHAAIKGVAESSTTNTNGGALIFATSNSSANLVEQFRISSTGNVGIGTASPHAKLDVAGSILLSNSDSNILGLFQSVPAAGTTYPGVYSYGSGLSLGTSGPITFIGNGGNIEVGRFSSTGNFGIGTTSPSEKLTVNGNIRAKKIIVSQSGWSDYVFDETYKLRSLSSLETFIKQYSHLPEVPSAKEVEEKGISVGDNQALLLKKIEELTLYVIQLKKITEKQQEEIQNLKNQKGNVSN